jgi:hypothetical protein
MLKTASDISPKPGPLPARLRNSLPIRSDAGVAVPMAERFTQEHYGARLGRSKSAMKEAN